MNTISENAHCPLCRSSSPESFFEDTNRTYRRCPDCKLVFVPKTYWLSPEAERATYDRHQNDAHDQGYRRFLSRLAMPLLQRLGTHQTGLDFGCGPGPTLSVLLEAHGHRVELYDPFYYNKPAVFSNSYDFICATEVVEHLYDPHKTFSALFRMLKPGGWLGIMTKLVIDARAFKNWHYIRDMTHVGFFSRSTFAFLAQRFNARLNFVADDVILLNKR